MKTFKIVQSKILAASATAFMLFSCGANPLKSYEKEDPAEDAAVALENDNPNKAIEILNKALEGDPTNSKYISLLAMAYAERAGIDALSLAMKMASNNSSGTSSSTNSVTALFSVMPDATDEHIADVDKAVSLMYTISAANQTSADKLKIAMFQTAALTLRTKKYDTDGDGVISLAEALAMSGGDASSILSQLSGAASAFSSSSSTSSTDQAASAQITSIQTKISTCPGSTQQSQLQNYLAKNGC
jgi:hypothetical protein